MFVCMKLIIYAGDYARPHSTNCSRGRTTSRFITQKATRHISSTLTNGKEILIQNHLFFVFFLLSLFFFRMLSLACFVRAHKIFLMIVNH